MRKRIQRKGIVILAAAALLAGGMLYRVPQRAQAAAAAGSTQGLAANAAGSSLQTLTARAADDPAKKAKASGEADTDKTETVYGKADASGRIYEVSVETRLRNPDPAGTEEIADDSILQNIKNTEGDEEFRQEGTAIYWENHGEDIQYKGTTKKALPVTLQIHYYLDGKEIRPDDLAGRSGALRMRIDYENTTSQKIEAGDRTVEVPVPFSACTILFLPEDTFANVHVENGRVTSIEDNQVVIGLAMPGLEDCLRLGEYELTEEIEIPEYVEITADVTDFKLDFTATVLSTGLFGELEEEDLDDLQSIPDDAGELTEASEKLADGGKKLYDGAGEFGQYLTTYVSGASQLEDGISQLSDGISALAGSSDDLTGGADALRDGLKALDQALAGADLSGSQIDMTPLAGAVQALAADAGALGEALGQIQTLTGQLQTFAADAARYQETAGACIAAAIESLSSLETTDLADAEQAAQDLARDQARGAAAAAVREALAGSGLTEEEIGSAADQAGESAADAINLSGTAAAAEDRIRAEARQAAESLSGIPPLTIPDLTVDTGGIEGIVADMGMQLQTLSGYSEALAGLGDQAAQVQEAIAQVRDGVSGLAQGSDGLSQGVKAYTDAVSQISQGAGALQEGVSAFGTGGQALSEGYTSMLSGIAAMSDGLAEFDREISKEVEKLAGEDFKDRIAKIKGLRSADLAYDNFAGLAKGQTGSVRFLIETDEIK